MQAKSQLAKVFAVLTSCSMVLGLLFFLVGCGSPTRPRQQRRGAGKSPADIHVGFVSETSSLNFAGTEMAVGAQYAANQLHVNAQIVAPPNIDDKAAVKLFQGPPPEPRKKVSL